MMLGIKSEGLLFLDLDKFLHHAGKIGALIDAAECVVQLAVVGASESLCPVGRGLDPCRQLPFFCDRLNDLPGLIKPVRAISMSVTTGG
jgi:hypothetical protein